MEILHGNGIIQIPKTHLSWVVLHWKIQVLKRPKYNDNVKVETWCSSYNTLFFFRNFRILSDKGEVLVIGLSQWTLVSTFTGKIAKIPQDIIDSYEIIDEHVFGDDNLSKLEEPKSHSEIMTYIVPRANIDFNKHVNNLYYLDIAYETLPDEVYEKRNDFDFFEVMYRRQCKLGDNLKCLYSEVNDDISDNQKNISHYITIKSEDQKTLHAIIKLQKI